MIDKISQRILQEKKEALDAYPGHDWFVIALQGSQNYGIADEESDIDSKLLLIPTFDEIVFAKNPVSHTHEMSDTGEHVDCKDVRAYMKQFRKCNINFVEILFTDYFLTNPLYSDLWIELRRHREEIARINPYQAISAMAGMASMKMKALDHPYPSRMHMIEKYGYDCYEDDTYFLTNHGWKTYDEIEDDDLLGTINPQSLELEFQNFYDRVEKANKDVYEIDSWYSNFSITKNHNLFVSDVCNINKNGSIYKQELSNWHLESLACSLDSSYDKTNKNKHILSFPKNPNKDNKKYSDDFLFLLGAFVSEGTCLFSQNKKLKDIRISQTNHGKKEFFIGMNNIATIPIKAYSYNRADKTDILETTWCCSDKDVIEKIYQICGHGAKNKRINPEFILSLSQRQARIVLQSLMLGDGSWDKDSPRRIYYSSSYNLAKDVLLLSKMAGYESNLLGGQDGYYYENGNSTFGNTPMWHVSVRDKEIAPHFINVSEKNKKSSIKNKKSNKRVVCFSVPNGTLITMRKGKTAVQGNCKQLSHLVRIEHFTEAFIYGAPYAECIKIPDENFRKYLLRLKRDGAGLSLDEAKGLAENSMNHILEMKAAFQKYHESKEDENTSNLLDNILREIIARSLKREPEGM